MRAKYKTMLCALLAVLALSAVASAAAQAATEGPFYKIAGSRLLSGESKGVTLTGTSKNFVINGLLAVFWCKKQSVASGAKVLGSSGANPAQAEFTLELSECRVEKNGTECALAEERIVTQPLTARLVYLGAERKGALGLEIEPVKPEVLAHLKWNETKGHCNIKPENLRGGIVARIVSGKTPVEVGKEPTAAAGVGLSFNEEPETVWYEENGTLKQHTPTHLTFDGDRYEATLSTATLELVGGGNWGVFT